MVIVKNFSYYHTQKKWQIFIKHPTSKFIICAHKHKHKRKRTLYIMSCYIVLYFKIKNSLIGQYLELGIASMLGLHGLVFSPFFWRLFFIVFEIKNEKLFTWNYYGYVSFNSLLSFIQFFISRYDPPLHSPFSILYIPNIQINIFPVFFYSIF